MCISVSIKGMICLVVLDRSYLNYQVSKKKKKKKKTKKTEPLFTSFFSTKEGKMGKKLPT